MYYEESESPKKKKRLSEKEAKLKAADYCAYQERSQQEVRDKLYSYGLYTDAVEEIISDLITEGFINEERFAKSYCRGKFRLKKWGRNKILQGLKQHRVSDYCVRQGLAEIDEGEYLKCLADLAEKKKAQLKSEDPFIANRKTASYLIQKGYEPTLIWTHLSD